MLEYNEASTVEICWFFEDGTVDCWGAWLSWLVTCGPLVIAGLLLIWKISRWTK